MCHFAPLVPHSRTTITFETILAQVRGFSSSSLLNPRYFGSRSARLGLLATAGKQLKGTPKTAFSRLLLVGRDRWARRIQRGVPSGHALPANRFQCLLPRRQDALQATSRFQREIREYCSSSCGFVSKFPTSLKKKGVRKFLGGPKAEKRR